MNRLPKYTVVTNLRSPESGEFVGMCWEFFVDEGHASLCYQRHMKNGSISRIRSFKSTDVGLLGEGALDQPTVVAVVA